MQCAFQFLAGSEVMALKYILDTTIEPLNHAVGLGRSWRGQAVFDVQDCAKFVELMFAAWCAFTQAKEAVSELLAIIRQYGADTHWTGTLQITQEATRIGCRLVVIDADEDSAGGTVNRHEQIAAGRFICHLWQVFQVDVDISGLIGLEATVLGAGGLDLQVAQIAHSVTAQAAIQPRA